MRSLYTLLETALPVVLGFLALSVAFVVINRTTRVGVVARGSFREAIRQPLFLLMIAISVLLFVLYIYLPFFSFKDETKMFIDCGISTVLVSTMLLGVWTASGSVSDEVEGKTVMTLLSKPVTRSQFILGKYIGVMEAVLVQFLILAVIFAGLTYYKAGYDHKETGGGNLEFFSETDFAGSLDTPVLFLEPQRTVAMAATLPGMALVYMQTAVMAAVAVALSTSLPTLVTITACLAIFVIGHLTPVMVQASPEGFVFVKFVAQLFATLLPSLQSYDASTAVSTGKIIPNLYLLTALIYSGCYIAFAMLLAFLRFEDRDLA